MHKKLNDSDVENELKEVFRVFGKDETGDLGSRKLFFKVVFQLCNIKFLMLSQQSIVRNFWAVALCADNALINLFGAS